MWPDEPARAAFMRLQTPLQGRKTRYENLHLTLAFLGQQPADRLPLLASILEQLPRQPITLTVDRIGYFTRKKIAWAGIHSTPPALALLHEQLNGMLAQHAISFDDQVAFRPHITLARDAEQPDECPFAPFTWQCKQLALVESVTQQEGAVYRVLASSTLLQNLIVPVTAPLSQDIDNAQHTMRARHGF
jgi:2'-5' RNA ligase